MTGSNRRHTEPVICPAAQRLVIAWAERERARETMNAAQRVIVAEAEETEAFVRENWDENGWVRVELLDGSAYMVGAGIGGLVVKKAEPALEGK